LITSTLELGAILIIGVVIVGSNDIGNITTSVKYFYRKLRILKYKAKDNAADYSLPRYIASNYAGIREGEVQLTFLAKRFKETICVATSGADWLNVTYDYIPVNIMDVTLKTAPGFGLGASLSVLYYISERVLGPNSIKGSVNNRKFTLQPTQDNVLLGLKALRLHIAPTVVSALD
jgi:hypothetical protein